MYRDDHNGHPQGTDEQGATAVAEVVTSPSTDLLEQLGATPLSRLIGEGMLPEDAYNKYHNPETYEVEVTSSVTVADYERITPPEDMARLKALAESMEGQEIMFVNATAAGGGVSIMRGPLIHLMQELGVNARWFALKPDEEKRFFDVTKQKFHNVLQDVAPPGTRLTEADATLYDEVIEDNAEVLEEPLSTADVIVIDDWQPSGLIPHIKGTEYRPGINPNARILFRDHIHTEGALMGTPGTPQYTTWHFIWDHNQVKEADAFITHPKKEFVPPNVPDAKVVFMPATGDKLDDLNRDLTNAEQEAGLAFINQQLAENEEQNPLDLTRLRIVLIARFDPSKGMPEGMESYAKAIAKMKQQGTSEAELPQLVVLGNGSVDDPDGIPLLKQMMDLRRERYGSIKDDIKIARVPHNDRAINALLGGASLALQPSTKEGFESRVTDAILAGVPVIGSDQGGIPLQIREGESGYVINPHNTDAWAERIAELMTSKAKYQTLRARTTELAKTYNYQFTTVPNAIRWLSLSKQVLDNPNIQGNQRWVEELPVPVPVAA
jgi:alpha,alpha-trehalose phosphorylase (configuration-retaining)